VIYRKIDNFINVKTLQDAVQPEKIGALFMAEWDKVDSGCLDRPLPNIRFSKNEKKFSQRGAFSV
jgi:hypothetical protein